MKKRNHRPRKQLRFTYTPPARPGWYAYSHNEERAYAVHLDAELLQEAQDRYNLALLFDLIPTDLWSTRKLKKREMKNPSDDAKQRGLSREPF